MRPLEVDAIPTVTVRDDSLGTGKRILGEADAQEVTRMAQAAWLIERLTNTFP